MLSSTFSRCVLILLTVAPTILFYSSVYLQLGSSLQSRLKCLLIPSKLTITSPICSIPSIMLATKLTASNTLLRRRRPSHHSLRPFQSTIFLLVRMACGFFSCQCQMFGKELLLAIPFVGFEYAHFELKVLGISSLRVEWWRWEGVLTASLHTLMLFEVA